MLVLNSYSGHDPSSDHSFFLCWGNHIDLRVYLVQAYFIFFFQLILQSGNFGRVWSCLAEKMKHSCDRSWVSAFESYENQAERFKPSDTMWCIDWDTPLRLMTRNSSLSDGKSLSGRERSKKKLNSHLESSIPTSGSGGGWIIWQLVIHQRYTSIIQIQTYKVIRERLSIEQLQLIKQRRSPFERMVWRRKPVAIQVRFIFLWTSMPNFGFREIRYLLLSTKNFMRYRNSVAPVSFLTLSE